MEIGVSVVAAFLIGAVLIYDRLGGNSELGRRLFQVGLAASFVFLAVSATAAFVLQDEAQAAPGFAAGDRATIAFTVHYGLGVALLMGGLIMLRRYHTVPLALILGGIFLITLPSGAVLFARFSEGSRGVDVVAFIVALIGTGVLLWYGTTDLEKQFTVVEEDTDEEDVAEGVG